MLRESDVPYLTWAQTQLDRPSRVCLVDSGLRTSVETLGLDLAAILDADPPQTGSREVPRALGARYRLPPEEILPVLGTSMGIFLACAAVLSPGDVVLVEQPGYQSLSRVPEALGARVVRFPRRRTAGWTVDPQSLLDAWPAGTRLVLLSDLHNPTGREAGDDALAALGEEAARRGATVLVDEVYRDFRPGTPGTARHRRPEVITVSSLTKVYGLGSLRLGWLSAPREILESVRALIRLLHALDPAPQEAFYLAALTHARRLRAEAHRRSKEGWAVVREWSRAHPELDITEPHGGVVAWLNLPEGQRGRVVAERLAGDGVTVVPGHFFGDDTGLRFSFSRSPEEIRFALDAMARVVLSG